MTRGFLVQTRLISYHRDAPTISVRAGLATHDPASHRQLMPRADKGLEHRESQSITSNRTQNQLESIQGLDGGCRTLRQQAQRALGESDVWIRIHFARRQDGKIEETIREGSALS
jgi:hypothetical protein